MKINTTLDMIYRDEEMVSNFIEASFLFRPHLLGCGL
jgi:hypothetical protein